MQDYHYHTTIKNTQAVRDAAKYNKHDRPFYNELFKLNDGECYDDIQHPKFFSMNENHPYYYAGESHVNNCSLKYTTIREINLIDVGRKGVDKVNIIDNIDLMKIDG